MEENHFRLSKEKKNLKQQQKLQQPYAVNSIIFFVWIKKKYNNFHNETVYFLSNLEHHTYILVLL